MRPILGSRMLGSWPFVSSSSTNSGRPHQINCFAIPTFLGTSLVPALHSTPALLLGKELPMSVLMLLFLISLVSLPLLAAVMMAEARADARK